MSIVPRPGLLSSIVVLTAVVGLLDACGGRREEKAPTAGSGSAGAQAGSGSGTGAADPQAPADAGIPDAQVAAVVLPDTTPARRVWSSSLPDEATFLAYSKEVGAERFTKFVIDLKTDAIYYFDVNVYPVHKDFVFAELYKQPKTKAAIRSFDRNYSANKPEFLLCYVVHHLKQDVWTFAFWDGDKAKPEHVRRAFKRMAASFFHADQVKYRPDSNHQEAVAKLVGDVPFILNDQLYKLSPYQLFNEGVAVGTLRIVPPESVETELSFTPEDIVVLQTPLADITPVAGIISETFSSPLSHLSLRAKGWGIPNIGLRGASADLAALAGKPVYFEAKFASHVIRAATEAEVTEFRKKRATRPVVVMPPPDLTSTEMESLATMTADDAVRYGPKASNLGVIMAAKLPNIEVPPGFGVPFSYYRAHLRASGADKLIEEMLADPIGGADLEVRKQQLAVVRATIEAHQSDPALCKKLGEELAMFSPDQGLFVRSSHNAEDMDTFSGAGLHETVANIRGVSAVCTALKKVWASAWKQSAFEARQFAGIDQRMVAGGALVQLGVPATSAGVMVTVHPTDPTDERNYTINAKSGLGMAVVDGRKVPESLMVSWYNHGIRVLSRSDEDTLLVFDERGGTREIPNPNKGKPVMTNKMAILLADTGKLLTKLFKNDKLDVEWVFVGEKLYIVQTRPLVGH